MGQSVTRCTRTQVSPAMRLELYLLVRKVVLHWLRKLLRRIPAKVPALIQRTALRLKHETKPHSSCISAISEPSMWFITVQIIMSLLVYRRTQDNLLRSLSPLPGWVRPANHSPWSLQQQGQSENGATWLPFSAVITIQLLSSNKTAKTTMTRH